MRSNSLLAMLLVPVLPASHASSQPLTFEVADLRLHDPKTTLSPKGRILPGGRLEAGGMTVQDLLMFAYGVLPDMIAGLPPWAKADQFDLIAKAGHDTPNATIRLMLRALLAERFKLASHQEDRVMPAYVLTVGKKGPQLQRGSGTQQHCAWTALPAGVSRRDCQNMTISELTKQLPGLGGIGIDLPVVDSTRLDGPWDFHLDVRLAPPASGAAEAGPSAAIPEGPTIFDAMESLGLKLEPRKVPLPVLVVDHIEPLIEN
jgi:uncharacterized protein (TIGR03435 family)